MFTSTEAWYLTKACSYSTLLISSTSIISETPVGISCGKFEVLRPFAFSADCYIFYTRSLFTSKRRAIASARSVLVLARTSGSGPGEDFSVLVLARTSRFWSWRGLLGSGPGEDFWFWSWRGLLVLLLARSSGSVRRLYFTSPRQLANKDRNKLISYNKTSIERIDIGIIAKN